ncbi:hypothetical protein CXG81DRAFT_17956 [Caulochytrium protostelioides]|uniref:Uncharacterized protein n=1 Tax=Caulochytrium protostelioides TaxID=1555241 RepID=A0A4P9XB95_9FUNG|nr:hypothetical protein CXG81DRAFT_17956 [Caulochytrium protostelioides]|eukprot:RKP02361.1 hypothetical protein CXG81DRAFT_17956 [Caulochytrium protostelioides]
MRDGAWAALSEPPAAPTAPPDLSRDRPSRPPSRMSSPDRSPPRTPPRTPPRARSPPVSAVRMTAAGPGLARFAPVAGDRVPGLPGCRSETAALAGHAFVSRAWRSHDPAASPPLCVLYAPASASASASGSAAPTVVYVQQRRRWRLCGQPRRDPRWAPDEAAAVRDVQLAPGLRWLAVTLDADRIGLFRLPPHGVSGDAAWAHAIDGGGGGAPILGFEWVSATRALVVRQTGVAVCTVPATDDEDEDDDGRPGFCGTCLAASGADRPRAHPAEGHLTAAAAAAAAEDEEDLAAEAWRIVVPSPLVLPVAWYQWHAQHRLLLIYTGGQQLRLFELSPAAPSRVIHVRAYPLLTLRGVGPSVPRAAPELQIHSRYVHLVAIDGALYVGFQYVTQVTPDPRRAEAEAVPAWAVSPPQPQPPLQQQQRPNDCDRAVPEAHPSPSPPRRVPLGETAGAHAFPRPVAWVATSRVVLFHITPRTIDTAYDLSLPAFHFTSTSRHVARTQWAFQSLHIPRLCVFAVDDLLLLWLDEEARAVLYDLHADAPRHALAATADPRPGRTRSRDHTVLPPLVPTLVLRPPGPAWATAMLTRRPDRALPPSTRGVDAERLVDDDDDDDDSDDDEASDSDGNPRDDASTRGDLPAVRRIDHAALSAALADARGDKGKAPYDARHVAPWDVLQHDAHRMRRACLAQASAQHVVCPLTHRMLAVRLDSRVLAGAAAAQSLSPVARIAFLTRRWAAPPPTADAQIADALHALLAAIPATLSLAAYLRHSALSRDIDSAFVCVVARMVAANARAKHPQPSSSPEPRSPDHRPPQGLSPELSSLSLEAPSREHRPPAHRSSEPSPAMALQQTLVDRCLMPLQQRVDAVQGQPRPGIVLPHETVWRYVLFRLALRIHEAPLRLHPRLSDLLAAAWLRAQQYALVQTMLAAGFLVATDALRAMLRAKRLADPELARLADTLVGKPFRAEVSPSRCSRLLCLALLSPAPLHRAGLAFWTPEPTTRLPAFAAAASPMQLLGRAEPKRDARPGDAKSKRATAEQITTFEFFCRTDARPLALVGRYLHRTHHWHYQVLTADGYLSFYRPDKPFDHASQILPYLDKMFKEPQNQGRFSKIHFTPKDTHLIKCYSANKEPDHDYRNGTLFDTWVKNMCIHARKVSYDLITPGDPSELPFNTILGPGHERTLMPRFCGPFLKTLHSHTDAPEDRGIYRLFNMRPPPQIAAAAETVDPARRGELRRTLGDAATLLAIKTFLETCRVLENYETALARDFPTLHKNFSPVASPAELIAAWQQLDEACASQLSLNHASGAVVPTMLVEEFCHAFLKHLPLFTESIRDFAARDYQAIVNLRHHEGTPLEAPLRAFLNRARSDRSGAVTNTYRNVIDTIYLFSSTLYSMMGDWFHRIAIVEDPSPRLLALMQLALQKAHYQATEWQFAPDPPRQSAVADAVLQLMAEHHRLVGTPSCFIREVVLSQSPSGSHPCSMMVFENMVVFISHVKATPRIESCHLVGDIIVDPGILHGHVRMTTRKPIFVRFSAADGGGDDAVGTSEGACLAQASTASVTSVLSAASTATTPSAHSSKAKPGLLSRTKTFLPGGGKRERIATTLAMPFRADADDAIFTTDFYVLPMGYQGSTNKHENTRQANHLVMLMRHLGTVFSAHEIRSQVSRTEQAEPMPAISATVLAISHHRATAPAVDPPHDVLNQWHMYGHPIPLTFVESLPLVALGGHAIGVVVFTQLAEIEDRILELVARYPVLCLLQLDARTDGKQGRWWVMQSPDRPSQIVHPSQQAALGALFDQHAETVHACLDQEEGKNAFLGVVVEKYVELLHQKYTHGPSYLRASREQEAMLTAMYRAELHDKFGHGPEASSLMHRVRSATSASMSSLRSMTQVVLRHGHHNTVQRGGNGLAHGNGGPAAAVSPEAEAARIEQLMQTLWRYILDLGDLHIYLTAGRSIQPDAASLLSMECASVLTEEPGWVSRRGSTRRPRVPSGTASVGTHDSKPFTAGGSGGASATSATTNVNHILTWMCQQDLMLSNAARDVVMQIVRVAPTHVAAETEWPSDAAPFCAVHDPQTPATFERICQLVKPAQAQALGVVVAGLRHFVRGHPEGTQEIVKFFGPRLFRSVEGTMTDRMTNWLLEAMICPQAVRTNRYVKDRLDADELERYHRMPAHIETLPELLHNVARYSLLQQYRGVAEAYDRVMAHLADSQKHVARSVQLPIRFAPRASPLGRARSGAVVMPYDPLGSSRTLASLATEGADPARAAAPLETPPPPPPGLSLVRQMTLVLKHAQSELLTPSEKIALLVANTVLHPNEVAADASAPRALDDLVHYCLTCAVDELEEAVADALAGGADAAEAAAAGDAATGAIADDEAAAASASEPLGLPAGRSVAHAPSFLNASVSTLVSFEALPPLKVAYDEFKLRSRAMRDVGASPLATQAALPEACANLMATVQEHEQAVEQRLQDVYAMEQHLGKRLAQAQARASLVA